jgi:hypothetical protein
MLAHASAEVRWQADWQLRPLMHRTAKSRRIGWNDGGLTVLIGDSKANTGEGTRAFGHLRAVEQFWPETPYHDAKLFEQRAVIGCSGSQ